MGVISVINKTVNRLAGANIDIDLTCSEKIPWKQCICPWNELENSTIHKCAVKNVSICPYFCGIEYIDKVLCSYPNDNSNIKNPLSDINSMIPFDILDFEFTSKPLLIGGLAMEFYGLRKAGADIDLVITNIDYQRLAQKYPDNKRDLWGDLGVFVHVFEIWRSICWFDYDFLSEGAIEMDRYLVVSFEKLFFMRVLAMEVEKYRNDLQLMVGKVRENQNKEFEKEFEMSRKDNNR
jgi:hypothetical protein